MMVKQSRNEGHPFVKRRLEMGLTQGEVASAAGVSIRSVQAWEAGQHTPKLTLDGVANLCDLFDCSVRELAGYFPDYQARAV